MQLQQVFTDPKMIAKCFIRLSIDYIGEKNLDSRSVQDFRYRDLRDLENAKKSQFRDQNLRESRFRDPDFRYLVHPGCWYPISYVIVYVLTHLCAPVPNWYQKFKFFRKNFFSKNFSKHRF
jgi:hypothetical protein